MPFAILPFSLWDRPSDPVWGDSDSAVEIRDCLSGYLQPPECAQLLSLPMNTVQFGFVRVEPDPTFYEKYATKSRSFCKGFVATIPEEAGSSKGSNTKIKTGGSNKRTKSLTKCHMGHLPAFIYSHPGVDCEKAAKRGHLTLLSYVSESGRLSSCLSCVADTKGGCTILNRIVEIAESLYSEEEGNNPHTPNPSSPGMKLRSQHQLSPITIISTPPKTKKRVRKPSQEVPQPEFSGSENTNRISGSKRPRTKSPSTPTPTSAVRRLSQFGNKTVEELQTEELEPDLYDTPPHDDSATNFPDNSIGSLVDPTPATPHDGLEPRRSPPSPATTLSPTAFLAAHEAAHSHMPPPLPPINSSAVQSKPKASQSNQYRNILHSTDTRLVKKANTSNLATTNASEPTVTPASISSWSSTIEDNLKTAEDSLQNTLRAFQNARSSMETEHSQAVQVISQAISEKNVPCLSLVASLTNSLKPKMSLSSWRLEEEVGDLKEEYEERLADAEKARELAERRHGAAVRSRDAAVARERASALETEQAVAVIRTAVNEKDLALKERDAVLKRVEELEQEVQRLRPVNESTVSPRAQALKERDAVLKRVEELEQEVQR
ncbi:hypothetical protein IAR55_002700 [Kwoniella newhampshirensis]|uniref:Uncharacterized protein n=1 Tax=Kwoniella newhampshirensis TaxID=1651941 RepID=A0AAW0YZR4_9TREE